MSKKPTPKPIGRPIAIDRQAVSASPDAPAFIARPESSPVYYGFEILPDVSVDGFTFGKITDFEAASTDVGDAFVIAPDNSRAGLVWEVYDTPYFREACAFEESRWGVWAVSFQHPMTSRENVRRNLQMIVPELRVKWENWKKQFQK